jgi:ATP-dependent Lon protease
MQRVQIEALIRSEPYTVARIEPLGDEDPDQVTIALGRALAQQFGRWLDLQPQTNDDGRNMAAIRSIAAGLARQPGPLSDFVASIMDLEDSHLRTLLEQRSIRLRLDFLLPIMASELQMLEVGAKIQQQVRRELGQGQREHYLREQLKAIQQELGSPGGDTKSLRERLASAKLSAAARSEAEHELQRLDRMPEGSAEGGVVRSYLEILSDLPWQRRSRQRDDVSRTRKILAQDHEGLEAVKERILEYVAVRKLTAVKKGGDGAARAQVLCFVGPPGVGKTSLARSIARSLGRKYLRLSLGGVRDEAEIRGHRRTYVGAMPGRLIQGCGMSAKGIP